MVTICPKCGSGPGVAEGALISGRVLYGGKGIPNFPVRLLLEIFGRARRYLEEGKNGWFLKYP